MILKNIPYCSYETCMLLKQKGFNEVCDAMYCDAYLYNGEYINSDHIYEYEDEGKKLTIEHGGMFYDHANTNQDGWMSETTCSLVAQQVAAKWLFLHTNTYIIVKPYVTQDGIFWICELVEIRKEPNDMGVYKKMTKLGFSTPELAYEFGINELAKTL